MPGSGACRGPRASGLRRVRWSAGFQARCAHRNLGARRRRGASAPRDHLCPAGIGKSRLTLEFVEPWGLRPAECSRALGAVRIGEPVRRLRAAGEAARRVLRQRQLPVARAKLERAVEGDRRRWAGRSSARTSPSSSGSERTASRRPEALFFSARVLVEALAADRPAMLLFEDIHWADRACSILWSTLAARIRDVPAALARAARPELFERAARLGGWPPAYTALPLDRLHRWSPTGAR